MNSLSTPLRRRQALTILRYAVLLAFLVLQMIPTVWILTSAVKPLSQVFTVPVQWIPHPVLWRNFVDAWGSYPFGQFMLNSLILTTAQTAGNLLFALLAGYGFAKFSFPGKRLLFIFVLSTMMFPLPVIMIPLFKLVNQLGWYNTYPGLIVPGMVTGFGIFFMRQYLYSIPDEYIEAARIDGASEVQIFLRIIAPLSASGLVTLAVLAALASWDQLLWPLVVATQQTLMTLPVGLSYFNTSFTTPVHWLLDVAIIFTLPMLLLFIFAQRRIIESTALTGIRG